jgi:hypothetical protein
VNAALPGLSFIKLVLKFEHILINDFTVPSMIAEAWKADICQHRLQAYD